MKIVIVMTYFDRQFQLNKTLHSFTGTHHNDFEVMIVDDCSSVPPEIGIHDFPITVLKTENKQWIDGSPAYNIGIAEALKKDYGSTWKMIANLQKKGITGIIDEKEYRGNVYSTYWLTSRGITHALEENADPDKLFFNLKIANKGKSKIGV